MEDTEEATDVEIETEWGVCENVEISMAELVANGFEEPPDEPGPGDPDYPVA